MKGEERGKRIGGKIITCRGVLRRIRELAGVGREVRGMGKEGR